MKDKNEIFKSILNVERLILIISLIMFISLVMVITSMPIGETYQTLLIYILTIYLVMLCFLMLRIEQIVGYFECSKCHHKHTPSYLNVLKAMHIGRTRYLKCPKCNKKSWNKKVIN